MTVSTGDRQDLLEPIQNARVGLRGRWFWSWAVRLDVPHELLELRDLVLDAVDAAAKFAAVVEDLGGLGQDVLPEGCISHMPLLGDPKKRFAKFLWQNL